MHPRQSYVFYPDLNKLCQKFLIKGKQDPTPFEIAGFPKLMKDTEAAIFENLLLFDCVAFKVQGESVPLAVLVNLFGVNGIEALAEQNALKFVLWTSDIVHFVSDVPGVEPIAPINFSTKHNTDPEESITLGLNWLKSPLDRRAKKILIRALRDRYTKPAPSLVKSAVDITRSAYVNGKLDRYGFDSSKVGFQELNLNGRVKIATCATSLQEYSFLLQNQMCGFSNQEFYDLLVDTHGRLKHAESRLEDFCKIAMIEEFPDLRMLYQKIESPFTNVIKFRAKGSSQKFRQWLGNPSQDANDAVEITRAYIDAIVSPRGFFQTVTGKITKAVTISSIGAGVGALAGGVPGAAAGVAIGPVLEKAADLGIDMLDQFALESVLKGWTPRMFIDGLRKLDKK